MSVDILLHVLRVLALAWGIVLALAGVLIGLYLVERWLDRHDDWVLWEDDLDESDSNVVRLPSRPVIHDFDRDGHL